MAADQELVIARARESSCIMRLRARRYTERQQEAERQRRRHPDSRWTICLCRRVSGNKLACEESECDADAVLGDPISTAHAHPCRSSQTAERLYRNIHVEYRTEDGPISGGVEQLAKVFAEPVLFMQSRQSAGSWWHIAAAVWSSVDVLLLRARRTSSASNIPKPIDSSAGRPLLASSTPRARPKHRSRCVEAKPD
jgi:hypothetical protein